MESPEFNSIISSEDPDFTPFLADPNFRNDKNLFQLVTAFDYELDEAKTIYEEDGTVCNCTKYQA